MKNIVISIWLAVLIGFCLPPVAHSATVPPPKKAVLVLFPYQPDMPANILAWQAIQDEFNQAADLTIDLYPEYLDLNRFPDDAYQQQLLSLYATKYSQKKIDLVVVSSEVMLNLWLEQRAKILPGTPVVFFDIITEHIAGRQFPADVTGVSGVVDYVRSVQWLLRTRPSVKEIVIVHGVGKADQGFMPPVQMLKDALQGQVQLTDLSDLPLAEIKQRAAALPVSSVILYHLMFEDAAGVKYRPVDALRELAGVSAVPVLSAYDQFIGSGTIGGYMYSVEQQGRAAAGIGLRILRGEAAGAIPIESDQSNRFIFDHRALQRYNLPLSALPPESVVKNRQYSLWESYWPQIIAIGTVFLALLTLSVYLLGVTRQLNKTRLALTEVNASLETQVEVRTADLSRANNRLEEEVSARIEAEESLRQYTEELESMQDELREQALRDPLTGAFNRRYLVETLMREMALADRNHYPISLLMLDIDHFKQTNDIHGHQAGDEVLINLVNIIAQRIRKSDILCRYGGEEFVVLLPQTTSAEARNRAEQWRAALRDNPAYCCDRAIAVTVSIGIATNQAPWSNRDDLILQADRALYAAKAAGRDCVVVYDDAAPAG